MPLSAGVAASGLGGAGAAAASSLPRRRRLSLGLREAGAGKVPSRGPGSGGSRPCVRLPRLRAAAGPRVLPPAGPHGQPRSPQPAPLRGRAAMSERALCERAGSAGARASVGGVGTSEPGRRRVPGPLAGAGRVASVLRGGLRRALEISGAPARLLPSFSLGSREEEAGGDERVRVRTRLPPPGARGPGPAGAALEVTFPSSLNPLVSG